MKKIFNFILVFVLLSAIFIGAIVLDVPNYITAYTKPDENMTVSVSTDADADLSKYTGIIEYVLMKNENKWEGQVPDAFYMQLGGVKNIIIKLTEDGKTKTYEYNSSMGVLERNGQCLYLKGGDKLVFTMLFEE